MTVHELIRRLKKTEEALGEDVEVELVEIEDGRYASDRYGVSVGLKAGGKFIGLADKDPFYFRWRTEEPLW